MRFVRWFGLSSVTGVTFLGMSSRSEGAISCTQDQTERHGNDNWHRRATAVLDTDSGLCRFRSCAGKRRCLFNRSVVH